MVGGRPAGVLWTPGRLDVDVSVGGLNQARTAVCQRYTNMQSPSVFSAPSLPESSWLESREMDLGCGCRVSSL